MGFAIKLDTGSGELETLFETESDRVTRVGLNGPRGESGSAGITPDQTFIILSLEFAPDVSLFHPSLVQEVVEEEVVEEVIEEEEPVEEIPVEEALPFEEVADVEVPVTEEEVVEDEGVISF